MNPAWTPEEVTAVCAEVGRRHGTEREALRARSELIAALEDPRWGAEETAARRGEQGTMSLM